MSFLRKVLPLAGHKSVGMRTCHRVYCECGWSSEAHWERAQAWSEYRSHVRDKGGEYESFEKSEARHKREVERIMKKAEEVR